MSKRAKAEYLKEIRQRYKESDRGVKAGNMRLIL